MEIYDIYGRSTGFSKQNHQNRQATPKMHLLMGGGQDAKERAAMSCQGN